MISHADAIDRIGDAATERLGIERLMSDPSSDPDVRAHVHSCDACQREIRAWQTTAAALMLAAPAPDVQLGTPTPGDALAADIESVPPLPADVRSRVLATVQSQGIARGTQPDASVPVTASQPVGSARAVTPPQPTALFAPPAATSATSVASSRRPVRFRWLALAAAAVLIVFVAGALLGQPLGLVHGAPTDRLRTALAASGQILEQPDHRQAALVDGDGTAVGSVLIDGQNGNIVVLSTGGDDGTGTAEYHCYLIRDGSEPTWLGKMVAQAGTSFWAGHVDDVTDLGRPGDVIQVTDGGSSPEFTATF